MASHALIAGWWSFENCHATAGDVLTSEVVSNWLDEAGVTYDVAVAPPFTGGVDWRAVDPSRYSHAVFVCGPFEKKRLEAEFLERFAGCRLIGVNLTMPVAVAEWNPFDFLLERDTPEGARPDIAFLSRRPLVPVIGVCRVEDYDGPTVRVTDANAAMQRLVDSVDAAAVPIDTRLDENLGGLRTAAQIESLIARMDAVVTTRLHGMVLSLKNGVPPIVIDPEAGGAKVRRQADRLGWPVVFNVDELTDEALRKALAFCLTPEGREHAGRCGRSAMEDSEVTRAAFAAAIVERDLGAKRRSERPPKAPEVAIPLTPIAEAPSSPSPEPRNRSALGSAIKRALGIPSSLGRGSEKR